MTTIKTLIENAIGKGLTQRELAVAIGISQSTINNILANIQPKSLNVIWKIAAYFKVDFAQLAGGHVQESRAAYMPGPAPSPAADRILDLMGEFDEEEQQTLLRCAELLERGDMEMRQGLIGQMKLLARTMPKKPPRSRAPKHQATGT